MKLALRPVLITHVLSISSQEHNSTRERSSTQKKGQNLNSMDHTDELWVNFRVRRSSGSCLVRNVLSSWIPMTASTSSMMATVNIISHTHHRSRYMCATILLNNEYRLCLHVPRERHYMISDWPDISDHFYLIQFTNDVFLTITYVHIDLLMKIWQRTYNEAGLSGDGIGRSMFHAWIHCSSTFID